MRDKRVSHMLMPAESTAGLVMIHAGFADELDKAHYTTALASYPALPQGAFAPAMSRAYTFSRAMD
jgi:hypothetical protein